MHVFNSFMVVNKLKVMRNHKYLNVYEYDTFRASNYNGGKSNKVEKCEISLLNCIHII